MLLLHQPHRDEEFISPENNTGTFKDECYLRGLFSEGDEVGLAITEATKRMFDPRFIGRLASELRGEAVVEMGEQEVDEDTKDLMRLFETGDRHLKMEEQQTFVRQGLAGLTPSQLAVFHTFQAHLQLRSQWVAFVTGAGGTGKSHILKMMIALAEGTFREKVAVCATSGTAAFNVSGQTVHRFFLFDLDLVSHLKKGSLDYLEVYETKVIFIDECSMMSRQLLQGVDDVLRTIHNTATPFGGVSLVLLGDLYQLPAVAKEGDWLVRSALFRKCAVYVLLENVRQKGDTSFVELLQRQRVGVMTAEDRETLRGRICGAGHPETVKCQASSFPAGAVTICSLNTNIDEVNNEALTAMSGALIPIPSVDTILPLDRANLGTGGKKSGLPETLRLKIGARVVLTRNLDVAQGLVNGALGTVREFHTAFIKVAFDHGVVENITRVRQDLPYDDTRKRQRRQFPLGLAFALTVHRVQGTTVEHASVHLDKDFFAPGQAYVALSRVRTLEGLHLKKFSLSAFLTDPTVRQYYDNITPGPLLAPLRDENLPEFGVPNEGQPPPPLAPPAPPAPPSAKTPVVFRVTMMPRGSEMAQTLMEEEKKEEEDFDMDFIITSTRPGRPQLTARPQLLRNTEIPAEFQPWTRWSSNSCHFDSFEMAMRVALNIPVNNNPPCIPSDSSPSDAMVLFEGCLTRGTFKQEFRNWFSTNHGDGKAAGGGWSSVKYWLDCYKKDPDGGGHLGVTLRGGCCAASILTHRILLVYLSPLSEDMSAGDDLQSHFDQRLASFKCPGCKLDTETVSITLHSVLAVEFAGGREATLDDAQVGNLRLTPVAVTRFQTNHYVTYLYQQGQWYLYDGREGIYAPEMLMDDSEMIGERDVAFYRVTLMH